MFAGNLIEFAFLRCFYFSDDSGMLERGECPVDGYFVDPFSVMHGGGNLTGAERSRCLNQDVKNIDSVRCLAEVALSQDLIRIAMYVHDLNIDEMQLRCKYFSTRNGRMCSTV